MKRSLHGTPCPEDFLASPDDPPLKLELICNNCGAKTRRRFEYAMVNPEIEKNEADGWDGVLLSQVVKCKRCGAVDDYKLAPLSYMTLMTAIIKLMSSGDIAQGKQASGRVIIGVSQLWDGTVARRPSQVLAHLGRLTELHPESGEAWRRLGNAQERFGETRQAEMSWRKALEVDPDDLESAYSLANVLAKLERWPDAFGFLRTGIKLLPSARGIDPDHRRGLSMALVDLLRWVLDISDEPFALAASWSGGSVGEQEIMNLSSVDLRRIGSWNRLAEFLVSEDTVAADLIAELPRETPTLLERRLEGDYTKPVAVTAVSAGRPFVNPRRHVGRNDPCPCGSGRKYKKCCGR